MSFLRPLEARLAHTLFLFAAPAFSQGKVWVVDAAAGPGSNFTEIAAAINTASHGDTLLVRSGIYGPFTVYGKSLAITRDLGSHVVITGGFAVRALSAGQSVLVRGLVTTPIGEHGFLAANDAGHVQLEDCVLLAAPQWGDGVYIDQCNAVELTRCVCTGDTGAPAPYVGETGGAGVRARESNVYLHDCVLTGGNGTFGDDIAGAGGDGVFTQASFVYTAGCTFIGGTGGPADSDPVGPFGSGCGVPGVGGDGIHLSELWSGSQWLPSQGVVLDGSFTPGIGGFNYDETCPHAGPGQDVNVYALYGSQASLLGGPSHGFEIDSPVRELQSTSLTIDGPAGSLAVLLLSGLPAAQYLVDFKGVLLLSLPLSLVQLGAVPAGGVFTKALPIPAQAPGVESVVLRTQSVLVTPAIEILLGPPSGLVILDQGF